MAGNKKPRKKLAAVRLARVKKLVADTNRAELTHYTSQITELNTPMSAARINMIFAAVEKAVFDIEATGDGVVDQTGDYVFFPYDPEEAFSLPEALKALHNTLLLVPGMWQMAGLLRIARKLEAHMPLFASDFDAARVDFERARAFAATISHTEFIRLTMEAEERQPGEA